MEHQTIRILRRPSPAIPERTLEQSQPAVQSRTLEQREADYAAARRRIMGSETAEELAPTETSCALTMAASVNEPVSPKNCQASSNASTMVCTVPMKSTAIPLMSIPTGALCMSKSMEWPLLPGARSGLSSVKASNAASSHNTSLGSIGSSSQQQRLTPSFSSRGSSFRQQSLPVTSSPSYLSNASSVSAFYPAANQIFNNLSANALPNPNNMSGASEALDGHHLRQTSKACTDAAKADTSLNAAAMINHLAFLQQYQQALTAYQQAVQPMTTTTPPILLAPTFQNTCQQNTYQQLQHVMPPPVHYQASLNRFTYTSGNY